MKVAQLFIPKPRPENATQIATRIFRSERQYAQVVRSVAREQKALESTAKNQNMRDYSPWQENMEQLQQLH